MLKVTNQLQRIEDLSEDPNNHRDILLRDNRDC